MGHATPEEVRAKALRIVKEEVRRRLKAFSQTPAGKVVREAGREVVKAHNEGRDLSPYDLAAFCMEIPEIMIEDEDAEDAE